MALAGWGQTQQLRMRNFTTREGLASNVVNTIMQDRQGYLWMGTNMGLSRFDGYHFTNFYDQRNGNRNVQNIVYIVEDRAKDRLMVVGNDYRVLCFDLGRMQFVETVSLEIPPYDNDRDALLRRMEALGIHPRNMTNRHFNVHSVTLDDGLEVYGTTEDGLYIYNPKERQVAHYGSRDNHPILQSDYVNDVLKDHSGSVWVATTYAGIYQLQFADIGQTWHFIGETDSNPGSVRAFERLADNTIAVATMDGKVYRYHLDTRQYEPVQWGCDARVYTMATDVRGRLWMGTRGNGAWVGKDGSLPAKFECLNESDGLDARQIYDILFDPDGTVWLATLDKGLIEAQELRDGHFTFHTYLEQEKVRELTFAPDGCLWVAATGGVYRIKARRTERVGDVENVIGITCAPDGAIWAGTIGNGLLKIDGSGNTTAITINEGLADNSVKSVVAADDSTIVAGTDGGISIINTRKGSVRNVYSPQGMMTDVCNENAILKTADGHILVGTLRGFTELSDLSQQTRALPTVLEAPHITFWEVNDEPMCQNVYQDVWLTHRQNNLKIYFSSLAYKDMETVTFSYWLEGLDHAWRPSTKENAAIYNNLSPGHYRFHVRSCLSGSQWSEEQVCDIVIEQPWWWTWWARMAYLLLFTLFVWYEWHQYQQRLSLQRQLDQRLTALYTATPTAPCANNTETDESEGGNSDAPPQAADSPDRQRDREFLDKLDRIIQENLLQENLDVKFLATELCMSYSTLHRRMKALAGMTANEYVRKHRLAKAMLLLRSGQNVTEVAMQCGFNTPSYFTRCFKSEYGMLPSEV